jgi:putative transposase
MIQQQVIAALPGTKFGDLCFKLTEYIEIFYNRIRKQARLGYLSPAAFMQQYHAKQMAA